MITSSGHRVWVTMLANSNSMLAASLKTVTIRLTRMRRLSHTLPTIFSLLDTSAFGGAEQYLLTQCLELGQRGFPLVIATNNTQVKKIYQAAFSQHQLVNAQVINAPYRLDFIGNWQGLIKFMISWPRAVIWLCRTLWQLPHHSTICYWPGFCDRLLFSPLAKAFGNKLIWIEFGPLTPTFSKNWGLPKLFYFLVKHLPDHIITISQHTYRDLRITGHMQSSKISLIYPGIKSMGRSQLLYLRKHGRNWWKRRYPGKKYWLVWMGRLADENQTDLVIRAVAKLPTGWLAKTQLLIVGGGSCRSHLHQLTDQLGICRHVTFTGFVSEKIKIALLASATLFVFTRTWELEGLGLSTLEAMAAGSPVIVPNFGPQTEIIKHCRNGLLFAPNNVKDLTKQILIYLKNSSLRKRMTESARSTIHNQFNYQKSIVQLIKVLTATTPNKF